MWGFCVGSLICGVVLCALSSLAIILLRKRERESGLLYFNFVVNIGLFLGGAPCWSAVVAFSGHTHSLLDHKQ